MRLGVSVSYLKAVALAREAERLGYDFVLVPEGFRSDAPTVLGLIAGATERIGLVSGVMQLPARSPGVTALTAATLDSLTGGRFSLGLGVSNPDTSEGWYGTRFDQPLARMREYVEIVRMALRRETVRYNGEHFRLPPTARAGEPLRIFAEPSGKGVPILQAAVGPASMRLCGEISDGWIGVFRTPEQLPAVLSELLAGRRRAGNDLKSFEVLLTLPIGVGEPRDAARPVAAYLAHFLGMGDRETNLYQGIAARLGFEEEAGQVRDRYRSGDREGAAAAVPLEFIDQIALLGPVPRIARRMRAYAEAGVTALSVTPFDAAVDEQRAAVRAAATAFAEADLGASPQIDREEIEHVRLV
ncbi:LLM class flavin-dependent oxidoreductase [Amycolatopsis rubida]|uniref:Probable F420-dependent oxidoreductase, Rv3520c family n=1 Tax=Amycolatopsis rubida TaxID=112413 RepID=A0A1I5TM77_9PSEU|nr:LLM class flavin-dependent oxidoreductase [Amycolatopsis rubida]SFP84133.1 probable F420-dependent oxidoreductase, Rv3520c family [Amycolatopsis rubida]